MGEASAKSTSRTNAPSAERTPRSPANPSSEKSLAFDGVHALHRQGDNRALSHLIGGGVPLAPGLRAEMQARFGERLADEVDVRFRWCTPSGPHPISDIRLEQIVGEQP